MSTTSRLHKGKCEQYDCVIVGGGSAGVGAAIGAAKAGGKVLLIERYGFSGGAATASSVLSYCGLFAQTEKLQPVVGGAGLAVLEELSKLGVDSSPHRLKSTGNWIVVLNPEAVKLALDRLLREAGVEVRYHCVVCGATVENGTIRAVRFVSSQGCCEIMGLSFVDATGEGILAEFAHAAMDQSRDDPKDRQPGSFPIRLGGIAQDWLPERDYFRQATQSYNATNPDLPARDNGGVVLRLPGSQDIWWMALDVDADPLDTAGFTRDEMKARHAAWMLLAHLRAISGFFADAYITSTGPQIGIRESRHPKAMDEIRADMISSGSTTESAVALGGWPMEIHDKVSGQQYIRVGGEGYFGIPLDSLKSENIVNLLLAGRLIGADANAYGSIRVMGTAFATGQAAGVAAVLGAQKSNPVNVQAMRAELVRQGAIL